MAFVNHVILTRFMCKYNAFGKIDSMLRHQKARRITPGLCIHIGFNVLFHLGEIHVSHYIVEFFKQLFHVLLLDRLALVNRTVHFQLAAADLKI